MVRSLPSIQYDTVVSFWDSFPSDSTDIITTTGEFTVKGLDVWSTKEQRTKPFGPSGYGKVSIHPLGSKSQRFRLRYQLHAILEHDSTTIRPVKNHEWKYSIVTTIEDFDLQLVGPYSLEFTGNSPGEHCSSQRFVIHFHKHKDIEDAIFQLHPIHRDEELLCQHGANRICRMLKTGGKEYKMNMKGKVNREEIKALLRLYFQIRWCHVNYGWDSWLDDLKNGTLVRKCTNLLTNPSWSSWDREGNLTTLKLAIQATPGTVWELPSEISKFKFLKKLTLVDFISTPPELAEMRSLDVLELSIGREWNQGDGITTYPRMKELSITWQGVHRSTPKIINWLHKCNFPALEVISLKIMSDEWFPYQDKFLQVLKVVKSTTMKHVKILMDDGIQRSTRWTHEVGYIVCWVCNLLSRDLPLLFPNLVRVSMFDDWIWDWNAGLTSYSFAKAITSRIVQHGIDTSLQPKGEVTKSSRTLRSTWCQSLETLDIFGKNTLWFKETYLPLFQLFPRLGLADEVVLLPSDRREEGEYLCKTRRLGKYMSCINASGARLVMPPDLSRALVVQDDKPSEVVIPASSRKYQTPPALWPLIIHRSIKRSKNDLTAAFCMLRVRPNFDGLGPALEGRLSCRS